MFNLLKNLFVSSNSEQKILRQYQPLIDSVNTWKKKISHLSDIQLRELTEQFRIRLQQGETMDSLLPETFATVCIASKRVLNMEPFDVQILGGIVLHEGKIAEMKTGEGKTLVATMPSYLNALSEQGVHLVTVNDYLAKRDKEWVGTIHEFLGMTVGVICHDQSFEEKQLAYQCDIIYGTSNEFGFDYLRDNMVDDSRHLVQNKKSFAIVDEVDSILIDEARTPLIISGRSEDSHDLYCVADQITRKFQPAHKNADGKWVDDSGDYQFEEKERNISLTETGISKAENMLKISNLYHPNNIFLAHHLTQALLAQVAFKKDIDYIVESDQIILIDEHTGRKMMGRRYGGGLHQALEAKEHVKIQNETQTIASITFQNYFRMYKKLSGMTGTAQTEEEEFNKIYSLPVYSIPTNKPCQRKDFPDRIYRTSKEKIYAIAQEIQKCHEIGQPVLVGTITIEKSEELSKVLNKISIPHNVLNAKFHEKEAKIIEQAGQKGMVTIATNMAGRGTDIKLGKGVTEVGGLHILGTERHESRRIDNQLRGRSGRQGDLGSSRFYLALEDNLMRLFGSEKLSSFMQKLGFEEGQEIEHPWICKVIVNAQKKVETRNFEMRKHLLKYDNIMSVHREYIYNYRKKLLFENPRSILSDMLKTVSDIFPALYECATSKQIPDEKYERILDALKTRFNVPEEKSNTLTKNSASIAQEIFELLTQWLHEKDTQCTSFDLGEMARFLILKTIDKEWKDYLFNLDSLKEGIHLRAYAEKNPLVEYKIQASSLFEELAQNITMNSLELVFKMEKQNTGSEPAINFANIVENKKKSVIPKKIKIGRNAPCPCGSNKKYKKCCQNT